MSANPQIVDTETLAKMSGYKSNQHRWIEKWCEDRRIQYFPGRNGPCTTMDLLNAAKGLAPLNDEESEDIL